MNYKKMMLVAFVLLAILTIGAVGASDDADNLTAAETGGDDLNVDQSSLDDEILSTEDDDILGIYEHVEDDDGDTLYFVNIYDKINTDYDDNVVEYWFNENFTGTAAIFLNGTEIYNDTISSMEDTAYIYVEDLDLNNWDYGIYNMEFVYSGDEKHAGFTMNNTIELTYHFSASPDYEDYYFGIYGRYFTYYVNVPSACTGSVVYSINGKEYVLSCDELGEGLVSFVPEDIVCGINNVTFKYVGNDYPLKTLNSSFLVKALAWFKGSIAFDEPLHIELKLPDDANGILNVYEVYQHWEFDEDTYDDIYSYNLTLLASGEVKNGVSNLSVSNLSLGRHCLYINFTGNYDITLSGEYTDPSDYYYNLGVRVEPRFSVPKLVWVDGNATGEFRLPENYNGILTVSIGEESRKFDVVNGSATFDLFNLHYVDHEYYYDEDHYSEYRFLYINYYYADNENDYTTRDDEYLYVMMKSPQSEIKLIGTNESNVIVKDHGDFYLQVFLSEFAEGNLTIYIDDKFYAVERYYGDTNVGIDVDNLTFGKHEIRFEFSGDDYFEPSTAHASITVAHIDFIIPEKVIIGEYYGFEEDNNAYISMPDNATGDAILIVDGVEIETKKVKGMETLFDLSNLTYGNHTVTIAYQNGNYPSVNKTAKVEAKYICAFDLYDLIYGEYATVILPIGETGEVLVNIGGKEFKATIDEKGIARFNIIGIPAGEYKAAITHPGDDKYPAFSKEFNMTVRYYISSNFDEYDTIYTGELANYTLKLALPENATGKLVLYQCYEDEEGFEAYRELASKELVNGKAQINLEEALGARQISSLSMGLRAVYVGEDYDVEPRWFYEVDFNEFVVVKPSSDEKIVLGGNAVFTVKLKNHTGYFKVLGGDRYKTVIADNISLVEDMAKIEIPVKSLGSQYFKFVYVGDDDKFDRIYYIFAMPENITLANEASGDDAVLTVKLPDDASGILTAHMCSPKYSGELVVNYTYNGSLATINASNVPKGTWTLSYFVIEDEKYGRFDFRRASQFQAYGFYGDFRIVDAPIIPVSANLTATAKNIKQGEEAVIDISINANVSGKVLVGDKVVDIKDGKGVFKIPGLSLGTYTYTVTFEGDLFFINDTVTVSFKVLTDPKIVASDATVQYSAGKYYSVKVLGEDGKAVSGKTVVFVLNGKKIATATTGADGVAKFKITQPPVTKGNLVITALGTSAAQKLTIKHIVTLYSTTFKKSAKKITFKAKLAKVNGKVLKKKTITFKVNGKKVATAKTDKNGVAKITLKDAKATKVLKTLKAGKKVTYQAVYSKDVVQKTTKAKK